MSFAPSLQLAAGVSVAQPQEGGVLSPEGEIGRQRRRIEPGGRNSRQEPVLSPTGEIGRQKRRRIEPGGRNSRSRRRIGGADSRRKRGSCLWVRAFGGAARASLVDECRTRIVFDDGVELGQIGDGADA